MWNTLQNPSKSCFRAKAEIEFVKFCQKNCSSCNLNSNLLANLHNQQTWSPDHCFFAHLPSHLALFKTIVISVQTLSKELTMHLTSCYRKSPYYHLHSSFSVDTSPTPTPWRCTLSFKTFDIWHPLPLVFPIQQVSLDCFNWYFLVWCNVAVQTPELCSVLKPFFNDRKFKWINKIKVWIYTIILLYMYLS